MATSKKAVVKSAKKPIPAAKHAAPVKHAAPKKVAAKPVAKKSVPVKKASPAVKAAPAKKVAAPVKKTTTAKPAAKAPVKKAPPAKPAAKQIAPTNNQKTVTKKNIKPAAPAKKVEAPAKKAEAKKTVPAKKAAPAAKAPVKAAAKAPAKPVAKAPAKPVAKAAPAPPPAKKAVAAPPPPPPAPVAKAPAKKSVAKKKTLTLSQIPVKAGTPLPRPTPTPTVRAADKKPNVIIAHRRLENKSKPKEEPKKPSATYQPETYRSILDEPEVPQGPAYRYSDEDLVEFREIIGSRLEAARKELNYLQGLITRKDEAGTEDTENRYMNMEDGSGAMEREQMAQLASRQIQFMGNLEKALVRIENKTYGICRITGKLIDKARLRAVPHATLSIEAKNMMSSKQN